MPFRSYDSIRKNLFTVHGNIFNPRFNVGKCVHVNNKDALKGSTFAL